MKNMTAEELIAHCKKYDIFSDVDSLLITLLANKLKEAITPNPDEIHIVWRVKDVYEMAEMLGKDYPTEEQARAILKRMEAAGWQHIREIL